MKKPELLILVLALLATVAKVYCAWTTIGTADVGLFREFGHTISDRGLTAMYRETPLFNHTPLVGTFTGFAYDLSGGQGRPFARIMRAPGIVADLLSVFVLLWLRRRTGRPAWWALALFAVSPISFMVSGFHGNVDPLVPLALLLAAAACVGGEAALCGLCIGLACQVKIIPLLVAPVFFFHWWHREKARAFTATAAVTGVIGWLLPLLTLPGVFLKNVVGYSSIWGVWGITYLLRLTDAPALRGIIFTTLTPTQAAVIAVLKVIVIGGVLALAWRRRAGDVLPTLALAWLVFFVFAPGFGVQYLVWPAPFFLFLSARWSAAMTAAGSIALFAFYTICAHGLPWDKAFLVQQAAPQWTPWLLLPWATFAACLGAQALALRAKAESLTNLPAPADAAGQDQAIALTRQT